MKPRFLELAGSHLFTVCFTPVDNPRPTQWILHLPAFGEEMNKSRRMVAEQARAFARQGYGVLLVDYQGTGDSPGSLASSDWRLWRGQALAAVDWLVEQGAEAVTLWGLRLGGLMVLDILEGARCPVHLIARAILWQPVTTGKQFMNQFLRLRLAAGLTGSEPNGKETVKDLRGILQQGQVLEVAGYPLKESLVTQIEALDAGVMQMPSTVAIHWLEVHSNPQQKMTPVVQRVVDTWREAGVDVQWQQVTGSAFWSTQEIAMAPDLISVSAQCLPPQPLVPQAAVVVEEARFEERGISFVCQGRQLVGILHGSNPQAETGVVLVVGGPQYRPGSHRQFVELARELGGAGIPVLRFDYRGMGDSEGEFLGFEYIEKDIAAAVDELHMQCPGVRNVVLWGLCDAATAAVAYGPGDARVSGLVLLNPWVRSEAGEAKARLKHYYFQRLLQREFWSKIFAGRFDVQASWRSLAGAVSKATKSNTSSMDEQSEMPQETRSLAERFEAGLAAFEGDVLLILSGNDLTAAEFSDEVAARRKLRKRIQQPRVTQRNLQEADHTFSRARWKGQVALWTKEWILSR